MNTKLTQEQIDEYRERGVVVVEGFLDSDDLADARRCGRRAAAKSKIGPFRR